MKRYLPTIARSARLLAEFILIELVGRALYYSGILYAIAWFRRRFGRRRLIVPMYHRIRGESPAGANLLAVQRGVPLARFEQQLRVFQWFGTVLPVGEAFQKLHDPTCAEHTLIALSFDDGYRDNIELAVPAMQRAGVRGTIFPVVRTASGGRPLWWDELTRTLQQGSINGQGLVPYLDRLDGCESSDSDRDQLGPAASRSQYAEFLSGRLVKMPGDRRERVLSQLAERLGVESCEAGDPNLYATWNELRDAAAAGFEIGGHTVDHVVLPLEPASAIYAQIANGRAILERQLERPVRSFAYPNGGHDESSEYATHAAGFDLALTVTHGVNYADTDRFRLKRMPIGCERPFHLALKLALYGLVHRS